MEGNKIIEFVQKVRENSKTFFILLMLFVLLISWLMVKAR